MWVGQSTAPAEPSHFSPSARHVSEGVSIWFQSSAIESFLSHSSLPSWGPRHYRAESSHCSCALSEFLTHWIQEHTKMVVHTTMVGWFVKQQEIIGTAPQPRVLPDIQPNAWRHGHLFSIKEAGSFLEGWERHWAKGSAVWAVHLVPGCRTVPGSRGRLNSGQACHCYVRVNISVWVRPRSWWLSWSCSSLIWFPMWPRSLLADIGKRNERCLNPVILHQFVTWA